MEEVAPIDKPRRTTLSSRNLQLIWGQIILTDTSKDNENCAVRNEISAIRITSLKLEWIAQRLNIVTRIAKFRIHRCREKKRDLSRSQPDKKSVTSTTRNLWHGKLDLQHDSAELNVWIATVDPAVANGVLSRLIRRLLGLSVNTKLAANPVPSYFVLERNVTRKKRRSDCTQRSRIEPHILLYLGSVGM